MNDQAENISDDSELVLCEKCGGAMEQVGGGGATQSNGCDVDWVNYECPACGHRFSDI